MTTRGQWKTSNPGVLTLLIALSSPVIVQWQERPEWDEIFEAAGVAAVIDRLRALPGIKAVSWANVVPFGRFETLSSIRLEDRSDELVPARPRSAGEDFFRTAGIELLAGRDFEPEDAGEGAATVIVDKAFEDKYMGGVALGRRFGLAGGSESYNDVTIAGVVGSVRHFSAADNGFRGRRTRPRDCGALSCQ